MSVPHWGLKSHFLATACLALIYTLCPCHLPTYLSLALSLSLSLFRSVGEDSSVRVHSVSPLHHRALFLVLAIAQSHLLFGAVSPQANTAT